MTENNKEINQEDYDAIIAAIRKKECLLFIGAGASSELGIPTGRLMAAQLAHDLSIFPAPKLPEAASLYEIEFGRSKLFERLRAMIEDHSLPDEHQVTTYDFIATVENLRDITFTTNWDDELEYTFRIKGLHPRVIHYNEQIRSISPKNPNIIKLHGDFHGKPQELVVTSKDYRDKYAEIFRPVGLFSLLAHKLASATILFVGYSLEDENFRLLYDSVQEITGNDNRHYAVMLNPNQGANDYWKTKNIKIIDFPARDFFEKIAHRTHDFINRVKEKEFVFSRSKKPFIEYYGVAGCGKSELLSNLGEEYRFEGWGVINLDYPALQEKARKHLSQIHIHNPSPDQINTQITQILDGELSLDLIEKGLPTLLLIDRTEIIPASLINWLTEDWYPAMEKKVRDLSSRFRIIAAGRAQINWGKNYRFNSQVDPKELSLFDKRAIQEMLNWFVALEKRTPLDPTESEMIADDVLETTVGHPACIKDALARIVKDNLYTRKLSTTLKKRIYEQNVSPKVEGILQHFDKEARTLLEQACLVRHLLPDVLDRMDGIYIDKKGRDADAMMRCLKGTHLVRKPKEPIAMYVVEPFLHHALLLSLKYADLDRYKKINLWAETAFDDLAQAVFSQHPTLDRDRNSTLLVTYILNSIYHGLLCVEGKPKRVLSVITAQLNKYLPKLSPEEVDHLIDRCTETDKDADWDLIEVLQRIIPDGEAYWFFRSSIDKFVRIRDSI